jgi:hypothetical protein
MLPRFPSPMLLPLHLLNLYLSLNLPPSLSLLLFLPLSLNLNLSLNLRLLLLLPLPPRLLPGPSVRRPRHRQSEQARPLPRTRNC